MLGPGPSIVQLNPVLLAANPSNYPTQRTNIGHDQIQVQVTQPEQWRLVNMGLCGPRNYEMDDGRSIDLDYRENTVTIYPPEGRSVYETPSVHASSRGYCVDDGTQRGKNKLHSHLASTTMVEQIRTVAGCGTLGVLSANQQPHQIERYQRIKDVKVETNNNTAQGIDSDYRVSVTFRDGIGLELRYINGEPSRTLTHPSITDSQYAVENGRMRVYDYDPVGHRIKATETSEWEPLAPHLLSVDDWNKNSEQAKRIGGAVLQTLAGAGSDKSSKTKTAIALAAAGLAAYGATYATSLAIREGLSAALGEEARTSALGTGENPERDAALLFLYDFFHSIAAVAKDGAINAKKYNLAQGIDIGVKQIALPTLIGVIGKPLGVLKSWPQVAALVAPRPFTIAASSMQNWLLQNGVSKQKACAAYEGARLATITPSVAALQLATDGPGFEFSRIGSSAARTGAQFAQIYGAELNQWAQSATTFWQGDKAQEIWIHKQLAEITRNQGEEPPSLYVTQEKYNEFCNSVDEAFAKCWQALTYRCREEGIDLEEIIIDSGGHTEHSGSAIHEPRLTRFRNLDTPEIVIGAPSSKAAVGHADSQQVVNQPNLPSVELPHLDVGNQNLGFIDTDDLEVPEIVTVPNKPALAHRQSTATRIL